MQLVNRVGDVHGAAAIDIAAAKDDEEVSAWLRRILANNLANLARDFRSGKRDVRRERSLELILDNSSRLLGEWIAAEASSPSKKLQRYEMLERVAQALKALSAEQRQAVVLRHWQGLSLAEIARQLDRTPGAVGLLIHRGLKALREKLKDLE